jgi:hypothetical protein
VTSRVLRASLPFVVTLGVLYAISLRVDMAEVFAHLHADTLDLLLPALGVYAAVSLAIDAASLVQAGAGGGRRLSLGAMARVKAASYPLALLHYALGAGGLVVLLRRRCGLTLSDATGTVLLLAAFDLLALLLIAGVASAWSVTDAAALRVGLVASVLLAAPFGLWLLRSEFPLGPLEPLRRLGALRAARELPTTRLGLLLGLRALFVLTFLGLGGAAFASFGLRASAGAIVVGFAQVALVAALPIAVAGLGTSQAAFLYVFRSVAPADELLACSVAMSVGIIALRIAIALPFLAEFSRRHAADPAQGGA